MSDPVKFLHSMAQALAMMSLYAEGHPARQRATDASFHQLRELQRDDPFPSFSFLGSDVIYGQHSIRELTDWEWAHRLASAGIQRLEFHEIVASDGYRIFLEDVFAFLNTTTSGPSFAGPTPLPRSSAIRFGAVGVKGATERAFDDRVSELISRTEIDLREEADTVQWLHQEVDARGRIPLLEAEAVVRSLSLAMHGDSQIIIPLLRLREFDEYTTTHALNVAVLAMGLAEFIGLSPREVRSYGVAGMLHDLGKVKIPKEILTKAGKLSPEEWEIMRSHTVEGARIILQSDKHLDVQALVAFEHHIMIDGGGYPSRHFRCDCHKASTLVHVCDVYDALRTKRPYRDAWEPGRVLEYIGEGVAKEFDPDLARAFVTMMHQWEPRLATTALPSEVTAVAPSAA